MLICLVGSPKWKKWTGVTHVVNKWSENSMQAFFAPKFGHTKHLMITDGASRTVTTLSQWATHFLPLTSVAMPKKALERFSVFSLFSRPLDSCQTSPLMFGTRSKSEKWFFPSFFLVALLLFCHSQSHSLQYFRLFVFVWESFCNCSRGICTH